MYRIAAMLLVVLLASTASSATDGTLGAMSTGTVGISLVKLDLPRSQDLDVRWEPGKAAPSVRLLGSPSYHVSNVSATGNVITVMVTPE